MKFALVLGSVMIAAAGTVGGVLNIAADGASSAGGAALAAGGSAGFLSIHINGNPGRRQGVLTRTIDPASGLLGPAVEIDVVVTPDPQPAVAWNPVARRFLAVYSKSPDDDGTPTAPADIQGLILDETGRPLPGGGPFTISDDTVNGDYNPAIACDGRDWLVAWETNSRIRSRVVRGASTNAVPSLAIPTAVHAPGNGAAVAFGAGNDYLVVWRSDKLERAPGGRTVSPDGQTLGILREYDAPRPGANRQSTTVAALGSAREFVVGWTDLVDLAGWKQGDAVLRRAGPDGAPIAAAVVIDPDPAANVMTGSLALSFSPASNQLLAAWMENARLGAGTTTAEVRAARIDPSDLTVLETDIPIAATGAMSGDRRVSVASSPDSPMSLIQWRDQAGNSLPLSGQRYDMGVNLLSPQAAGARQYHLDGQDLASGGLTTQRGFRASVHLTDPEPMDSLQLDVEVKPAQVPFSAMPAPGELRTGGPVSPDQGVTVSVPLDPGAYHWRARARDNRGLVSAWTGEISLTVRDGRAPRVVRIDQLQASSGNAIGRGEVLREERSVRFRAEVADDDGDDVELVVEIKPMGQPLTGTGLLRTGLTRPGVLQIEVTPAPGAWHWSYALLDRSNQGTEARPFGTLGGADFEIRPWGGSGGTSSCFTSSAGGSGWIWLGVLFALAAVSRGLNPES